MGGPRKIKVRKPKRPRFLDKDNPLEKVIEKKVCDYGKTLGVFNRKYTTPAFRSAPDRIFFVPERREILANGNVLICPSRIFFIEFKSRGKTATEAQHDEHVVYRDMGFLVFVVDNIEEGKNIMRIMC